MKNKTKYIEPENMRKALARFKQLMSLRVPPYDLPADSFLEECINDIVIIANGGEPPNAEKRTAKLLVRKPTREELLVEYKKKGTARLWSVWMEGYSVTGEQAQARHIGDYYTFSFADAARLAVGDMPGQSSLMKKSYFNEDNLTYWGCRLFDNEESAREAFG